jgi:hypothetical protein
MKPKSLSKTRLKISQAQSNATVLIAVAVAICVFSLVSAKALLSQATYQRKVLHERRLTLTTLANDKTAAATLISQYQQVFENSDPINIIGGKNDTSTSAVPPDGDNARIILDSLPTSYDFPALISSVSSILANASISNPSINGTDQSATTSSEASVNPLPAPIQLSVGGTGTYTSVQKVIKDFERSTRPFDITNIQLSGGASSMTFSLQLTTYYQPAKTFNVTTQEVR